MHNYPQIANPEQLGEFMKQQQAWDPTPVPHHHQQPGESVKVAQHQLPLPPYLHTHTAEREEIARLKSRIAELEASTRLCRQLAQVIVDL